MGWIRWSISSPKQILKSNKLFWKRSKRTSIYLHLPSDQKDCNDITHTVARTVLTKRGDHFNFEDSYIARVWSIWYDITKLPQLIVLEQTWNIGSFIKTEKWQRTSCTPSRLFEMMEIFCWEWKREVLARDGGMVLAGKCTQMKQFCKLLKGELYGSFYFLVWVK